MTTRVGYALIGAGLIVAADAGCAARQQQSSVGPAAQAVQTPQQQSQRALESARDAQKRAADQEKRAAEAQQEVQRLDRELAKARQRAQQEQAKAERYQAEASQATQRATQTAEAAQQQAARALAQQSRQVQRGELTVTGHVQQVSPDVLVVQPRSGEPVTFALGGGTRIEVDGREATAGDVRPGEDALVSYEASGTRPVAKLVRIRTANPGEQGGSQTQDGGRTQR